MLWSIYVMFLGGSLWSGFGHRRVDTDGEVLHAILTSIDKGEVSEESRSDIISSISRQHKYPPLFMSAFFNLFLPANTSRTSVETDIELLVNASIAGAHLDCGLCVGFIGFFASVGLHPSSFLEVDAILNKLAFNAQFDFDNLEDLLHGRAAELGSTMGVLARFHEALMNEVRPGDLCYIYTDTLGTLAQETASIDVFNQLAGTTELDLASDQEPLSFVSPEAIESDTERLEYFVTMMKENAEIFTSSILFDPLDILEIMGLDSDISEEEIRSSLEGISQASNHDVAVEIVEAIKAGTYNIHASKYNEGLKLVADPSTCLKGLKIFKRIISSQNLFVKVVFHLLKVNLYRQRDLTRAMLVGLLLSRLGVLPGINAAMAIDELRHSTAHRGPQVPMASSKALLYLRSGMGCTGSELRYLNGSFDQCKDECLRDPDCIYVSYDASDSSCAVFAECIVTRLGKTAQLYEKYILSSRSVCWGPESDYVACQTSLREISGLSGDQTNSLNWLVRRFLASGDLDESISWAMRSAALGDNEGKYYLGTLEAMAWDGHPPDTEKALTLFMEIYHSTTLRFGLSYEETVLPAGTEDSEVATVRELASQLGVPFDDLNDPLIVQASFLPCKIAGLIGIVRTRLLMMPYWTVSTVFSLLASLPLILLLLVRRIA